MSLTGAGWELHILRTATQLRGQRRRTVGTYQVYHDGVAARGLSGMVAETRGPGDNSTPGNNRRVEAGRYPLFTQDGSKYVTLGYVNNLNPAAVPRPGLELKDTGRRAEILIHPGRGFLSSIGCINPCTSLPNAAEDIDFEGSRKRTIDLIDDLMAFLGSTFPRRNGLRIANAFVVIDGEP